MFMEQILNQAHLKNPLFLRPISDSRGLRNQIRIFYDSRGQPAAMEGIKKCSEQFIINVLINYKVDTN